MKRNKKEEGRWFTLLWTFALVVRHAIGFSDLTIPVYQIQNVADYVELNFKFNFKKHPLWQINEFCRLYFSDHHYSVCVQNLMSHLEQTLVGKFQQQYTIEMKRLSTTSNISHAHITLTKGDSVHAILKPYCDDESHDSCESTIDFIFNDFYGTGHYSPSRPTATYEDFISTRGDVVFFFLERFKYETYLEIGTDENLLFDLARQHFKTAVGVDPGRGGTHRMTSDEFFLSNSQFFDLIFIDGLHEANQAFRDVQNSLRWLKPNGTILIHDCNPKGNPLVGSYPRAPNITCWLGDTWKAAVALRMRMDVEIVVIDVDMGISAVRRRVNKHVLPPRWQEFLGVNPISMLNNDHIKYHRDELMRMMAMEEVRNWLDEEEEHVSVYCSGEGASFWC